MLSPGISEIMSILSENTDELIALSVVVPTILVSGYQAIIGQEITMPNELALIIIGWYFGNNKPIQRTE